MLGGSGTVQQNDVEERSDVVVYTTLPLAEDVEVTGPVSAVLYVATSSPSADFTAKLVDVHPDGFAQNVLDRVIRARFRKGSKLPPSLIEPRTPYEYTIDLGYTATVFKPGHRVRLDISSSNFPHLARNHNTGDDPANDARFVVATQTLLHDEKHPSYVELAVVPNIKTLQR